jgi:hypothetical protein
MMHAQLIGPVAGKTGLALLLLLPATTAQRLATQESVQRVAQDEAVVQSSDEVAPARKHVIHLQDGRVLRVRARQTAEGWELAYGREWMQLPASAVSRATPESELQKRARKLERELRGLDADRRVAYAQWLSDEGLREESLKQADKILHVDRDHGATLAFLGRSRIALALPDLDGADAETLDGFLRKAASYGPAGRELATQRLRDAAEVPGLLDTLTGELQTKSPRRRSFAALALRRLFTGRATRPLLSRAVLDASGDVRTESARALRDAEEPALVVPVLRALGSKSHTVRLNATQALGTMNYAAAVEPLYNHMAAIQAGSSSRAPHANIFVGKQVAYVSDFDVEVASNEAIADPQINVLIEGTVLDAALIGASETQGRTERAASRRALAQLTGAKPGGTMTAWEKWWNEHGDDWKAGAIPPGPPTSPASPGN